ncbi:MAG: damage-inducible protein CinA [Gammaproteobacteria bacterium GWE2_42_36]|nr:MAG: damage-inducible protein CinA [Gammaproteobacteria bacterium GWE2_42_36]HCU04737.1 damage-inducible protein CinA [Coxiellaceae bacterium]
MLTDFYKLSMAVGEALQKKSWKLVTAESCTGGFLAQVITSIAGCSKWFERGFVTYSRESKQEILGVPAEMIQCYGVVSAEVAQAMAEGALKHSHANIAVSITGFAGPAGGTIDKPVGTVFFGFAFRQSSTQVMSQLFIGDRESVREQAVRFALENLLSRILD